MSIFWKNAEPSLSRVPTSSATYLPDGHVPKFGDVFKNPRLAGSLRLIADKGRDAYYRGPIADQIVAYSDQVGGLFVKEDFSEHTSTWVEPVSTNYRGFDVWELPPNGQGIAALQMLNVLERFDMKAHGPQTAESLHLMIESKKLAFEDRAAYYADPEKTKVPVALDFQGVRGRARETDLARPRQRSSRTRPRECVGDNLLDGR